MLTRLIYASEAAVPLNPALLQALLEHARSANARHHLTGALVFDNNCFLQVLEGDREAVNQVYSRIAADPRHCRVVLLEVAAVDERRFGRWSMAFAPADARHGELYLRYGTTPRFDPYPMTAPAALALVTAMTAMTAMTAPA